MPARFAEIIPGVYRGGEPSFSDVRLLKTNLGIKRIVSLDLDIGMKIDPICDELGIEHIIVPVLPINVKYQVKQLGNQISDLLSVRPVFIHCKHGRDRTGLAIAQFRVANGWTPIQAVNEAKTFGFPDGLTPPDTKIFLQAILDMEKNAPGSVMPHDFKQTAPGQVTDEYSYIPTGVEARDQFDPGIPPMDIHPYIDTQLADDKLEFPQNGILRIDSIEGLNKYNVIIVGETARKYKIKSDKVIKLPKHLLQIGQIALMPKDVIEIVKEDQNDLMAQVAGFNNQNDSIFRALGPIEPYGIYPMGYSMIY